MSWHAQLEPRMSVTGSKADERHRVLPSQMGLVLRAILARLEGRSAETKLPIDATALDRIVSRLDAHRGSSLVVSGSQRLADQVVVNLVNERLANYGTTVDLAQPSNQRRGSDLSIRTLIDELRAGAVDVLIVSGANPLYDFAANGELERLFRRVPLTIAVSETFDETATAAKIVAPAPHFLESWGDAEPLAGVIAFMQPAISPLFASRALAEIARGVGRRAATNARDLAIELRRSGARAASAGSFEDEPRARVRRDPASGCLSVGTAAASPLPLRRARRPPSSRSFLYPKVAILRRAACRTILGSRSCPIRSRR